MHVAEIPSLYIWVLKKFHGFPVSRCRIGILCIDYRALVTRGWQCWQKEEVKKVFSICTCTKDNSPNNSYPSFIGSIIFSLAFGLRSVSMRAKALFLTCWSKSFQLRGVRDLWFFSSWKQTLFLYLSLPGLYTLFCDPCHVKREDYGYRNAAFLLALGAFLNTCNQAAKPSVTKCVIWYAAWLCCSWKVCRDHSVLDGHI